MRWGCHPQQCCLQRQRQLQAAQHWPPTADPEVRVSTRRRTPRGHYSWGGNRREVRHAGGQAEAEAEAETERAHTTQHMPNSKSIAVSCCCHTAARAEHRSLMPHPPVHSATHARRRGAGGPAPCMATCPARAGCDLRCARARLKLRSLSQFLFFCFFRFCSL
jgi:hypothetical protein